MSDLRNPAQVYFETHVEPNLAAWLGQPTDIRLAMNAVVSLYHTVDHFWHSYHGVAPSHVWNTKDVRQFRAEFARRDPNFAIIRDVAEAHKHMVLDRNSRALTDSSQTAVGSTGFGEAGFGQGPFGGGPSIVVKLDDGSKHHLSHVANEVKRSWLSMLV